MSKNIIANNKPHYAKLLNAIKTRALKRGSYYPFPEVSKVFSWWRIGKESRHQILYLMKEEGLIEVNFPHGIKILDEGVVA